MKKLTIGVVALALVLVGCQLFYLLDPNKGSLFLMMKTTTPVVAIGAARSISGPSGARTLTYGQPMYNLYYIFQDYVYPDDEGVVDTGNLYKLLFESSQIFVNRRIEAAAISPTAIASPFDFGNSVKTFTNAFNSIEEGGGNYDYTLAYAMNGDTVEACYGYTVREAVDGGTKTQRQIFETTFNEVTGDIALDFCTFDDKPIGTADDFGRRAYVEGNMLDHSFFIQFVTGQGSPVVGMGISLGAGYFILCQADTTPVYYRLEAGATEGNFEAAVGVTDIGLLTDPDGYAAAIQAYLATTAFDTRKLLPTGLDSFTNDGLLLLP
ncbi:MAG: hypothetical protein A2087_03200 [Spirochaetes bacterium GWD1_61_31]|nr:MAG: hypothetical protein A2Y37_12725 [Spirochaetes bacterium GWB1_60_80]OHD32932.1 MAG: hypothetical protein A2004_00980 [Spirochaetes bacterium GWC1_61_12]OHD38684.1 MAG: hypothetical protein A2087_03200 [Spirochaetes bacterium GWD1_61_31]OHD43207.1 MAG: hypothetical protein A2Y35_08230 [Spirochaetes bacterium GWE1_60_18]OHD58770.1 MAG: hypothetical protein A2Y32_01070 [Spirochaetes bacterium GWF1_60_12]HAP42682.1 hypothetical protein [Spirochaetaceae bacterium]